MLTELLSDLRYRLRAIARRRTVERELHDELLFHLEHETEKLVREGVSPDEAARRARLAFGGVERIKDDSRDARGLAWIDAASQDLRWSIRSVRRNPGFTLAVVLTIALGLGANAALFGIIDRLMFRAPPYLIAPARVHRVYVYSTHSGTEYANSIFGFTRYRDLQRAVHDFDRIAAVADNVDAVGTGADARRMHVGAVSVSFFSFFDVRPALGRFFVAGEDTIPDGARVVVLSYAYWQSRFGGRRDILGTTLQVGPAECVIVGVAPEGFSGADDTAPAAMWMPITTWASAERPQQARSGDYYRTYHWQWLGMLVRRKAGVGVAAADADLSRAYGLSYEAQRAIESGLPPASVARPRAVAGSLLDMRAPDAGPEAKVVPWISGVALIVLLIACANVANLLLARALRRRREIAVRLALGVSRGRLLSQLLAESVVLATLGGMAGLAVGHWGSALLRALFLPERADVAVATDTRTIVFASCAALAIGLLTGLVPALNAQRQKLGAGLKAGAREGTRQRSRIRGALLVFQGVLCVVLLIGAGLFVRSLMHVRALHTGYDVQPLVFAELEMRGTQLSDTVRADLARRLEAEAAAIPGVTHVSRALTVPFLDYWSEYLFVDGIDSVDRLGSFEIQGATPDYFATAGTRLLRGRAVTAGDRAGAPLVAVVSEGMARALWPGRDPLGRCFRVGADTAPCRTVVGVAENISLQYLHGDPGLQYYLPVDQFSPDQALLFLRVRGPASASVETIRRRLQRLMPGTSYITLTPMSEVLSDKARSWELGTTMFMVFGGLALALAAVGLYAVIAYDVAQRSQELGVRIALGAGSARVLRLVVGQAMRFAAAGIVIGAAIALVAGRWLAPLLFEESAHDPMVYGAVAAVLLAIAVAASAVPAIRACRTDPALALRAE